MSVKIKWSKYIPHKPTPKQLRALKSSKRELLYGGALGGGKSDLLLMFCLQYMDVPGYSAACFRKSLTDAKLASAVLSRCKEWLRPFLKSKDNPDGPVTYVPNEHTFYFKTTMPDGSPGQDATLTFCYIGDANARDRYQSAEFQTICFDEISQWPTPDDYEFMTTRIRKTTCSEHGKNPDGTTNFVDGCPECTIKKSITPRMRAATNPGGLGGLWIKKRWKIVPDPKLYPDRREAIRLLKEGVRVPFVSLNPELDFIAAYVDDNPYLDQTEYMHTLNALSPEMRSRLRDGNWEAREDSRFNEQDIRYYHLEYSRGLFDQDGITKSFKEFDRIFITVDPASTSEEGITDSFGKQKLNRMPSYGVASVWGVTSEKDIYFLNMSRARDEIPDQVKRIVNLYLNCPVKPAYVKAEENGVGKGLVQFLRRAGIPIKTLFKAKDKLENSTNAQMLMRAGKVYFPRNAEWIEEAEEEIFAWLGIKGEQDDIVDTFSDAANEIDPGVMALEEKEQKALTVPFVPSTSVPTLHRTLGQSTPLAAISRKLYSGNSNAH